MKTVEEKLPNYGGQALIEGVLMRGKKHVVAAFRKPNGDILVEEEKLGGLYNAKWSKLPLLRGLIILWDSLSLGMKYLTRSANVQADEEDEEIGGPVLVMTLTVSLLFSVLLFFVLPTLITSLIDQLFPLSILARNIIEGFVRLSILIIYLLIIGRSSEIKRVFAYHGAEHKTITAYENGETIKIDTIQKFSTAHPRCGTSFLLTLVFLSIMFFSLFGEMSLIERIATRIMMIPILAMLSYELIRWLGKNEGNPFVKLMSRPNLMLQKLTTREPDDGMVEVAITAFNRLLTLEKIK